MIFAGGLSVVLLAGAYRVTIGSGMTPGDLLVFISYVRSLQKPLRKAARLSGKIGKAAACADRISEILTIHPEEKDDPKAEEAPILKGNLRFDNVSFSYARKESEKSPGEYEPEDPPRKVIDQVNLEISEGEHVVLTGPNGAGKSTLTSLLLRLVEPDQGEISIDGTPIKRWKLRSMREQLSIVLQESFILSGSVREHLQFHKPEATDEEMLESLKRAHCDFIIEDPDGLDRELTEGGQNLSGGEKRRLTLSTALLRDSSIVILDEPTTAIDPESRKLIQQMLTEDFLGKTLLIITHDEDLTDQFESRIELENGKIKKRIKSRAPGGDV